MEGTCQNIRWVFLGVRNGKATDIADIRMTRNDTADERLKEDRWKLTGLPCTY